MDIYLNKTLTHQEEPAMLTTITYQATQVTAEQLTPYIGTRLFIEYRKADRTMTERIVKIINIKGENVTVWCEKRGGLRTFKLSGFLTFVPLTSATRKVV
jgi:hypothetical protein